MRDDLRAAFRSLRKSPTFTAIALAVLALGIGAATALYSVVDAVVLRGLPFDEHDRMAVVLEYETTRQTMFGSGTVTPQTYLDWRQQQQSFEGLTAVSSAIYRLKNASGEPADARTIRTTHEFFSTFRVTPLLGRPFTRDDEVEGQHLRVILSYAFWQRHFGGTSDVVGRTIDLNETPFEIIGVMPRGFAYPVGALRQTELYMPVAFRGDDMVRGNNRSFSWTAIGRLKPGITRAQAQDQMHRVSEGLDRQYPDWGPGRRARVITLHDHVVGVARAWMLMLLGAVGLLLLIACANVANLMLARATARAREVGIRAALGAGRWRVIRGLLVEGVVLSLCGACIGVLLAYAGVQALTTWLPANLPRVADIAIDLRVLAAAITAAVMTGVLFGIVPAFHASRADVVTVLKEGGRSVAGGGIGHQLRNLLVVAEVAIAVILLVGAGLFGGSFVQLIRIDPGFDYRNLLTLAVAIRNVPGLTPEQRAELTKTGRPYVLSMIEAIARVPGVDAIAGVQEGLPLSGSWSRTSLQRPGQPELKGDDDSIDRNTITANFFQTMRIPLTRGRAFSDTDRDSSELVAVLNEAAVRKYFPESDPLGQRIIINRKERVVVGVVADIRHLGLESPVRHAVYLPFTQESVLGMNLIMRTRGRALDVLPAVKAAIWSVNPEQRLTQETVTIEGYMDRLIAQRRFNMAMLVLFGVLGLIITAAGIYGVMAYVVEQRTGEIGVRMALGATPQRVMSMVLQKALLLMAVGVVIGAAAAWQLSGLVGSFLFHVRPNDIRIFVMALLVLGTAGLVASAIPARRASKVDPLVALRAD